MTNECDPAERQTSMTEAAEVRACSAGDRALMRIRLVVAAVGLVLALCSLVATAASKRGEIRTRAIELYRAMKSHAALTPEESRLLDEYVRQQGNARITAKVLGKSEYHVRDRIHRFVARHSETAQGKGGFLSKEERRTCEEALQGAGPSAWAARVILLLDDGFDAMQVADRTGVAGWTVVRTARELRKRGRADALDPLLAKVAEWASVRKNLKWSETERRVLEALAGESFAGVRPVERTILEAYARSGGDLAHTAVETGWSEKHVRRVVRRYLIDKTDEPRRKNKPLVTLTEEERRRYLSQAGSPGAQLTGRILLLLHEGYDVEQIGRRLHLSRDRIHRVYEAHAKAQGAGASDEPLREIIAARWKVPWSHTVEQALAWLRGETFEGVRATDKPILEAFSKTGGDLEGTALATGRAPRYVRTVVFRYVVDKKGEPRREGRPLVTLTEAERRLYSSMQGTSLADVAAKVLVLLDAGYEVEQVKRMLRVSSRRLSSIVTEYRAQLDKDSIAREEFISQLGVRLGQRRRGRPHVGVKVPALPATKAGADVVYATIERLKALGGDVEATAASLNVAVSTVKERIAIARRRLRRQREIQEMLRKATHPEQIRKLRLEAILRGIELPDG